MLRVTFLEFMVRGIPEGFLFMLAAHVFAKNAIQKERYILSSLLDAVLIYLCRFLPIQHGADFILNLFLLIALTVIINRIDIINAIKSGIISILLEFICEGANVFVLQVILKKDLNVIFKDPVQKLIYSGPSLLFFGCIVITYYMTLRKRKELKMISYGKVNE